MSKKQDKIKDTILRSTENSVASVADDNVKANMEVETEAGMEPKILRSSDGKCCAWCSSLVGEYYEDEAPDDIYARHDNCNCTVTYESEKGYQDAHTKKWIDQQELEARRERIAADKNYIKDLRKHRDAEKVVRIKKNNNSIDFYAGPRYTQVVPAQYKQWIGDNKYKQLIKNAPGEESKKYIRTAYRKTSVIGDGGTVAIRKFEKATGLNCGRGGRDHSIKVSQLINLINNALKKNDMEIKEREYLLEELRVLKEVL